MSEFLSRRQLLVGGGAALTAAALAPFIPAATAFGAGIPAEAAPVEAAKPHENIGVEQFVEHFVNLAFRNMDGEKARLLCEGMTFGNLHLYDADMQDVLFRSMLKTAEVIFKLKKEFDLSDDIHGEYSQGLNINVFKAEDVGHVGGAYSPSENALDIYSSSKDVLATIASNEMTHVLLHENEGNPLIPNCWKRIMLEAQSDILTSVVLNNAHRGDPRWTFYPSAEEIWSWQEMIDNKGYNEFVPAQNIKPFVYHIQEFDNGDMSMLYLREHLAKVAAVKVLDNWKGNRSLADVMSVFTEAKSNNQLYRAMFDMAQDGIIPHMNESEPLQEGKTASIITYDPYQSPDWPIARIMTLHNDNGEIKSVPQIMNGNGRFKAIIMRGDTILADPPFWTNPVYEGNIFPELDFALGPGENRPPVETGDTMQILWTNVITGKQEGFTVPIHVKPPYDSPGQTMRMDPSTAISNIRINRSQQTGIV